MWTGTFGSRPEILKIEKIQKTGSVDLLEVIVVPGDNMSETITVKPKTTWN